MEPFTITIISIEYFFGIKKALIKTITDTLNCERRNASIGSGLVIPDTAINMANITKEACLIKEQFFGRRRNTVLICSRNNFKIIRSQAESNIVIIYRLIDDALETINKALSPAVKITRRAFMKPEFRRALQGNEPSRRVCCDFITTSRGNKLINHILIIYI